MEASLTRAGIVLSGFPKEVIALIRKRMTVHSTGYQGSIKTMQAHFTDRKTGVTVIGRARGFQLMDTAKIKVTNALGGQVNLSGPIQFICKLADHQKIIRDYLLKHPFSASSIAEGRGVCYLQRKAGQGKTFIALSLVNEFRSRTLYICHNILSMEQTRDAARAMYPGLNVGEWHGKRRQTGDITVAVITSLLTPTLGDQPSVIWFRQFGYVVLDEVPEYCTADRSKIFMKVQTAVTLGMSATPDERLDKMDKLSYLHLGKPIIGDSLVTTSAPVNWNIDAVRINYDGPPEFTEKQLSKMDTVSHPLMVNMFCRDPYRTQLIVNIVCNLVKSGGIAFVMLDRREYAALIVRLLRDRLGEDIAAPETEVQKLLGGSAAEERLIAKNTAKACCVTYKCAGVGLSFARYTDIVFGHPRKSGFQQFINRVFRLDGDRTKTRKLYYLCDNSTTIKSQVTGFTSSLHKEYPGTRVTQISVDWKSVRVSKGTQESCSNFKVEN